MSIRSTIFESERSILMYSSLNRKKPSKSEV